jgi:hypothetical protein
MTLVVVAVASEGIPPGAGCGHCTKRRWHRLRRSPPRGACIVVAKRILPSTVPPIVVVVIVVVIVERIGFDRSGRLSRRSGSLPPRECREARVVVFIVVIVERVGIAPPAATATTRTGGVVFRPDGRGVGPADDARRRRLAAARPAVDAPPEGTPELELVPYV